MEAAARPDGQTIGRAVGQLRDRFGERVVTALSVREQHAHGEGMQDAALPDVVVFPESNEEVAAILRLAHAARIPVIPFGTGTSLEGHLQALYGGISLDLSRMTKILEVNVEDHTVNLTAPRLVEDRHMTIAPLSTLVVTERRPDY
ncbi:MAG: FAD-binding oxidoreductase, partial [Casimicrobiaceae bacterium]